MQLGRLFEGKQIRGKMGLYPLTPESLMRMGLALCVYLRLHKGLERPSMGLVELNFITTAVAVGFMAGGGDVYLEEKGHVNLKHSIEEGEATLWMENMEEYELKMVESILFSRYNMPRAEGEEVGNLWIPKSPH